jgi:hypothetical protein
MAEYPAFFFLVLSFLMCILMTLEPLISLANQNHNNCLVSLAVPTLLFFLLPLTFLSVMVLLTLHVATPQSVYVNRLTMATRALTLATLLLGALLLVNFMLTSAVVPDTIKVAFIVAALLIAHLSLVRSCFILSSYLTTGFGPAFLLLFISTGTLLVLYFPYHNNSDSLDSILIHLLLFSIFTLAIALTFLRASAASAGP